MISGTYEQNGKNRKARLNRKYDDAEGRVGNLRHTVRSIIIDPSAPAVLDVETVIASLRISYDAAAVIAYNRLIAGMAHERGMSVGLKNDLGQVDDLAGDFDFAVNEECYAYDECEALTPFTAAGKAVFHVEYEVPAEEFCPVTTALGFSSMAKHLDLDAWRGPC